MAGFALKGFNHTGVIVTDLDRAIGFFRDLWASSCCRGRRATRR